MGPPVAPGLTEAETDALMDVKAAAAEALANGDLDAAQAQCSALMAVARDSTEGQLLLADIMLSK